MALLKVTFRSHALNHDTEINVILPDDHPTDDIPTLYLLHGMYGNHESWCRKTGIERYAAERHIAVVMPDGENAFYTDMKYGKKYFTYVADELVDYTRRILRLSTKRENTFVSGLSMGGYGAVKLALRRPEQYAACASLSGCLDIVSRLKVCPWASEAEANWGEDFRESVAGSDSDLFHLINTFPDDAPRPRIYAACGIQDKLYNDNLTFCRFMQNEGKAHGFDFKFEDGDGVHNWVFWDKWIVTAMDNMLQKC